MKTRKRRHVNQETEDFDSNNSQKAGTNAASKESTLIKKKDVINLIDLNSSKSNSKRLKNNILGHYRDYYNIHYKFDDYQDNDAYLNSLSLYSAKFHNFLNESWDVVNDSSILNLDSEFIFNANEFNNKLQYNSNKPYRSFRQTKRRRHFTKREIKKFEKLANPKKKSFNDELLNSDSDGEVAEEQEEEYNFCDLDEIQISDQDDDSENEDFSEEDLYCEGIVVLENAYIQLVGLATKNGYLNFKIINKSNRINREGISLYLNLPLKEINYSKFAHSSHLGIVYCTLSTGDYFFIDFKFNYCEGAELKSMVSYKYNILRKSDFQNSKFVDFSIIDAKFYDEKLLCEVVVMDRYGNYTNGTISNTPEDSNLKIVLNTSNACDSTFKGSLFDLFNMELPYKQIMKTLNSNSLFLFDNTKIMSVNKKTKQCVLITQHKFWSKVITCADASEFIVLLTNMEIIVTRKIEDQQGNSFLERVIAIKHYFNLLKYTNLSISTHKDELNGILIVFLKPLNIIYFFSIDLQTRELILMNNIPMLCVVDSLSKKNKNFVYLEGKCIYFLSELHKRETLQKIDLIQNNVHKTNLKVIKKLVINIELVGGYEEAERLSLIHESELKFKKDFKGRNNINRSIEEKKTNEVLNQSNGDYVYQLEVLENFGNQFYEQLTESFSDTNIKGSISMSKILPIPNDITNLTEFKNFNEQLCHNINTLTSFKIISKYDTDEKSIKNMWDNQLVLLNTEKMCFKQGFSKKLQERFTDDNFALLKNGIKQWNPQKFSALKQNNDSFNTTKESTNVYQSQKKKMLCSISAEDFIKSERNTTLSQPSILSQKHQYSQSNIVSQGNAISFVESTQKQDHENTSTQGFEEESTQSQFKRKKKVDNRKFKSLSQPIPKKIKKPKKTKPIGGTSGFF